MTFKPVGVDENGRFPARVEAGIRTMLTEEGFEGGGGASVDIYDSVEDIPPGTEAGTLLFVKSLAAYGLAPAIVSSAASSTATSGTTFDVTVPTAGSPTLGDLLLVAVYGSNSTLAQNLTPQDPTLERLSPVLPDLGGGNNSDIRISGIFGKWINGGLPATYTFTQPSTDTSRRVAVAMVIRGVDQITPISDASLFVGSNGLGAADVALPALDTVRPRNLQLLFGWSNGSSTDDFTTAPATSVSTTSVQRVVYPPTGTVSKSELAIWSREISAAGSTGAVTLDYPTRSQRSGFTLTLNPKVV